MERQPAHAGDFSIGACFLSVDDFDVIERLPANSTIRRSEDIDCSDQINFSNWWDCKENDALSLNAHLY
jgi:hypothetical protein